MAPAPAASELPEIFQASIVRPSPPVCACPAAAVGAVERLTPTRLQAVERSWVREVVRGALDPLTVPSSYR